jgi:hypothetical protein
VAAGSALAPFSIVPLLAVMAISAGIGAINARAEADGLRRGARDEIGRIRGKLNGISEPEAAEKLLRSLDDAEKFLESAGSDNDLLRSSREELRSLAMKASKAELDAEQRAKRAEDVRGAIAQIRAMGQFSEREQLERIKTDRIEEEITKISDTAVDDRMAEMRRMLDELDGVKNSRERIALGGDGILERGGYGGEKKTDETSRLISEIRDLASRISDLDEREGALAGALAGNLSTCTQFPDRLRSIRRQLSSTFASVSERAAATAYFRETLTSLRGELETASGLINSADARRLASRCDTLRGAKYIDRQDFMALYEDIAKFAASNGEAIADSYFAAKVREELGRMGYALAEDEGSGGAEALMEPGRVNYLETPYDGYRVMAKVGGGELSARLVRVTDADEPETAETAKNQAALDREAGQKWCGDFDEFLARMRDAGLPIDVTLRREPDEAEVIATPVKGAKKKKSARKSRARGSQTEGRMRARDGENE